MGRNKKEETVVVSSRIPISLEKRLIRDCELRTIVDGKIIKPASIIKELLEDKYKTKKSILDLL